MKISRERKLFYRSAEGSVLSQGIRSSQRKRRNMDSPHEGGHNALLRVPSTGKK